MKKLGFCLVLLILFAALATGYEEVLIEISVKYADGKTKWQEVCEAFWMDKTVLLPLAEVSPALGLSMGFDREKGLFTVTVEQSQRQQAFDSFGYKGPLDLIGVTPLEIDNEFYVHPIFLKDLLEIDQLVYDPLKMSFLIILNSPSPKTPHISAGQSSGFITEEIEPIAASPKPFQLSSFEYKATTTFRKDISSADGEFYLHSRILLAEVSIGLTTKNAEIKDPYFFLKYAHNDLLLKFGHTAFTSKTRIRNAHLLGLVFISPFPALKEGPQANLVLKGEKGQTATVMVNDIPVKELKIINEEPFSEPLLLRHNRYQKITVKNANLLTEKPFSNGLSLMEKSKWQLSFIAGLYGKKRNEKDGELFELSYSRGLTTKTTFSGDLLWQKAIGNDSPLLQVGFKSELCKSFSVIPTFYLNGLGEIGGEFTLHSAYKTGYFKITYYDLPKQILAYYNKPVSRGTEFYAEKELTPKLFTTFGADLKYKTKTSPQLLSYSSSFAVNLAKPLTRFTLSWSQGQNQVALFDTPLLANTLTLGYNLTLPRFNFSAKYVSQRLYLGNLTWLNRQMDGKFILCLGNRAYLNGEYLFLAQNGDSLTGVNNLDLNVPIFGSLALTGSLAVESTFKPAKSTENLNLSAGANFRLFKPFFELKIRKNQGQKGDWLEYSAKAKIITKDTGFSLEGALRQKADSSSYRVFKFSFNHQFENGFGLGITFAKLPPNPYNALQEYLGSISISHGLSFTTKGLLGHKYAAEELTANASGVVFLDTNGNGIKDHTEQGISGIEMKLGSLITTTDKNGFFAFRDISPQNYIFGFNPKKLSTDYIAPVLDFPIKVRNGDSLVLDMPLTMNGTLKGKVFLDTNLDGIFNENDISFEWVQIIIEGLNKSAFSNKDGDFYFEDLPLGEFTVLVDGNSLPIGVKKPLPQKIHITPSNLDCIFNIPLNY